MTQSEAQAFFDEWGFWPIIGADDGDDDDDGGNDDGNNDDNDDDDGGNDDDLNSLPENVRAIVLSEREKRIAAEKNAKAANRNFTKLEKKVKDLERSNATDEEKKIAEAREEAAKEEREKTYGKLKRASVRAEAAGKMNPDLAVKLVDLDEIDVDDDGEINASDVERAVKALLDENPELALKTGKKKSGGDTQNGKSGGSGGDGVDMNTALRAAVKGR